MLYWTLTETNPRLLALDFKIWCLGGVRNITQQIYSPILQPSLLPGAGVQNGYLVPHRMGLYKRVRAEKLQTSHPYLQ